MKIIDKICSLKGKYFRAIDESYLTEEEKKRWKDLIEERIGRLTAGR